MSENDTRVDKDGNVHKQNWAGQYEQQWDMLRQQPAKDDGERETQPDSHSWDNAPLYRRQDNSSASSSSSGGEAIGGLVILGFIGLGWLVSKIVPKIWKGAKEAVAEEIREAQANALARKDGHEQVREGAALDKIPCPACYKDVSLSYKRCPYCATDLSAMKYLERTMRNRPNEIKRETEIPQHAVLASSPVIQQKLVNETRMIACPACNKDINLTQDSCPHCATNLDDVKYLYRRQKHE